MNQFIERHKYLLLGFIIIISGIIIETNVFDRRFGKKQARKFESVLIEKIKQAKILLGEITIDPEEDSATLSNLENYITSNQLLFESRGISLGFFKDEKLLFWSDNETSFPQTFTQEKFNYKTVHAGHGWYFVQQKRVKNCTLVALSLIKREYPYKNAFLEDAYHHDFNMTAAVKLSPARIPGYYSIYDREGHYLLSLSAEKVRNSNEMQRSISVILYLVGLTIVLLFSHYTVQKTRNNIKFAIGNGIFVVSVITLRWIMYTYKIPYIFHSSPLFDPTYFAYSDFLPSLGDLLINTMILLFFSIQVVFILKRIRIKIPQQTKIPIAILSSSVMFVGLYYMILIIDTLIHNSNITLEPYKILEIDFFSFVAYLIIASLLNAYLILCNSIVQFFRKSIDSISVSSSFIIVIVAVLVLSWSGSIAIDLYIPLIFFVLQASAVYINYYNTGGFTLRLKLPMVIFLSFFIVGYVQKNISTKKNNIKRIYAENLENEQDPVTEILLIELESKIAKDSSLQKMMRERYISESSITNHLQKKYFSGFLSKYDLHVTVCKPDLFSRKFRSVYTCKEHFKSIISHLGTSLESKNIHFINNNDGSISYLITIKQKRYGTLYIELSSRFSSEELGYPELLLDRSISGNKLFSTFSFAKYKDGKLITQKGEYSYSITDKHFRKLLSGNSAYIHYDGYDHYLYLANPDLLIAVSSPQTKLFDKIISFSYIFLFLFTLAIIGELAKFTQKKIQYSGLNFKLKIQFAIVGVLLVSLVLIGASLIWLNNNEYLNAQYLEANEKINSVIVELEHRLGSRDSLKADDAEYAAYLLNKFATVFFADMHLYDLDGQLLASSRPEVFKHGLTGNQMNHAAFFALSIQNKVSFMHKENIGDMTFLSSYALIKNDDNQPLAYINLPYFTKQQNLSDRLSSLAATLINIFVLMILLSVATAIFVANKVTYPLQLLKNKISSISLGTKNEIIEWESQDEIGSLITDYNRMVRELEDSAEKLAESERLRAWHQMARQVAHEIKNPLTPMKLNIQLLKRAWENNDNSFEERLNKVATSLIEQIDALANTASEFSNFSQFQKHNCNNIDVAPLLDHACTLFSGMPKIDIITVFSDKEPMIVYADKEKLLRVFNNIIKNAIQAIPKDHLGEIIISLRKDDENALITVRDNGNGIPPAQQEKLFEPSFTTKSSGMGLGLGIVKNIIDTMGAQIWFESKENIGTQFYIKIPLVQQT